jgi:hypothetical protein
MPLYKPASASNISLFSSFPSPTSQLSQANTRGKVLAPTVTMVGKFQLGDAQPCSPLFKKLPLEIRNAIYRELFGNNRLHLEFKQAPLQGVKGSRRSGGPPQALPSLFHCICRYPAAKFHSHNELVHKWLFMNVNYIFTCRRA